MFYYNLLKALFGSGRLNLGEHEVLSGSPWPRFPQAFNRHHNEGFLPSNVKKMEYDYELLLHQKGVDFDGRSLYSRNKGLGKCQFRRRVSRRLNLVTIDGNGIIES